MVRKRLITVLTINNGVLFRTRNFTPDYRYTLSFVDAWSVDEVVLLDITRPGQGNRENFYDVVQQFASDCFVPLTVGGGVRTLEDFRTLLGVGADKIAVNTMLIKEPDLLARAARLYGSQCVVASIDAKRTGDGTWEAHGNFGATPLGVSPAELAKTAMGNDAGEILLQSIDHDGMLEGYDLELGRTVVNAVDIPVLLCSGAGNWKHFVDGFKTSCANAVCTTNIYHFTESSIHNAKQYMNQKKIPIRL